MRLWWLAVNRASIRRWLLGDCQRETGGLLLWQVRRELCRRGGRRERSGQTDTACRRGMRERKWMAGCPVAVAVGMIEGVVVIVIDGVVLLAIRDRGLRLVKEQRLRGGGGV
jgi:hypothetical protein